MATSQDVINKVREIAAADPDYVYNSTADDGVSCYYTVNLDHSPGGCIVGRALMAVGITADALERYDGSAADEVVPYLVDIDGEEDLDWLRNVQQMQDCGDTWAKSVTSADEIMGARVINE